jgi:hypothetical protein
MQNFKVREVFVKLETIQKTGVGQDATIAEVLLAKLENLSIEEADEILKTVEKLSDREIEFMLNETEHF